MFQFKAYYNKSLSRLNIQRSYVLVTLKDFIFVTFSLGTVYFSRTARQPVFINSIRNNNSNKNNNNNMKRHWSKLNRGNRFNDTVV